MPSSFGAALRPLYNAALALCALTLFLLASPGHAQSSQDPVYVFHTSLGNISVQLYRSSAPKTVANFLNYVNRGDYNGSIIHRSVPGFIFQGGGYQFKQQSITAIPADPPVVNEFKLSNLRGTIAMAKLGNDPNSATSQWFFNESDSNAANLDNQDGGFTVFGRVIDADSLAIMDKIAAVPVPNPSPLASPFDQIPLINYQPSQGVQASNLVFVNSITPAGQTHMLWTHTSGAASLWTINSDSTYTLSPTYGPYPNWTAIALSSAPDGTTHLLWTNTNGAIAVWNLTPTYDFTQNDYGPYPGWSARSLSTGGDGSSHVLWTKTDGTISLWKLDTSSGIYTYANYGPYPGWIAKALASGATTTDLLWNNTSGQASGWKIAADGTISHYEYGPYSNWGAAALSVGPDDAAHLLWDNTGGSIALWSVDFGTGGFVQGDYGPYSGWVAMALATGADNVGHVLWNHMPDSQASLWGVTAGSLTHTEYGPYSGWTALAISAGP